MIASVSLARRFGKLDFANIDAPLCSCVVGPSMPSEPMLPPKPIKSRSVISLTSLNSPSSVTSKSTPASPVTPKKTMSRSSSRSNISGAGPLGQGLTMTAANRQQYIQTMQRDYSMRLGGLGRDGGYAIAATMTAPSNGLHSNRGSVTDFGTMRYSGDWSGLGVSRARSRTWLKDFLTRISRRSSTTMVMPTRRDPRCQLDFTRTRRRRRPFPWPLRQSTHTQRLFRPLAESIILVRIPRACQTAQPLRMPCRRRPVL